MVQEVKKMKRKNAQKNASQKEQALGKEEAGGTPKKNTKQKEENKIQRPPVDLKYGPPVSFPYQRVWSRSILILGVLLIVWYNGKHGREISLAKQKDVLVSRSQNVDCSADYIAKLETYPGCISEKCGRFVTDKLVSATEVDVLLKLAKSALNLAGSDGGASTLDLYSGALCKGQEFTNVYELSKAKEIFNSVDLAIYRAVREKIQRAVAENFGVDVEKIYLTKPTFFSRMTNKPAQTIYDEYWHPHVDKETYESFYYTSLVYLNDYDKDFEGGRFVFMDKYVNSTIEPRKGRVSIFTSGSENLHLVEKVKSGTRYALTISFTCDKNSAISDTYFI
ncbi:2-oxoglutarate and iron-dependent oxygenase domain-containing protein 3 [Harpegnathos saltator]|uniref:PKHD domain-containing transmembrane protein FLJ22222-like protein n=1 Tax=Harpegnathos saltator TaxID=610380 RepID=E2BPK8_HARSA|nr:2-oxoglutarate and iron-dependent oxygenase domain-containing protein 3 [Harpegnathos saltator]EFN82412.1 PKHD domain-containing transmembrane protein FLJ22222-like protein [Harpegnathos saltator]